MRSRVQVCRRGQEGTGAWWVGVALGEQVKDALARHRGQGRAQGVGIVKTVQGQGWGFGY